MTKYEGLKLSCLGILKGLQNAIENNDDYKISQYYDLLKSDMKNLLKALKECNNEN